ncbi:hypothetical protein HK405_013558 [Cladochytrium tenue]|nr:hypothetical protein HK405_013558 [Cladochytrium tenue]
MAPSPEQQPITTDVVDHGIIPDGAADSLLAPLLHHQQQQSHPPFHTPTFAPNTAAAQAPRAAGPVGSVVSALAAKLKLAASAASQQLGTTIAQPHLPAVDPLGDPDPSLFAFAPAAEPAMISSPPPLPPKAAVGGASPHTTSTAVAIKQARRPLDGPLPLLRRTSSPDSAGALSPLSPPSTGAAATVEGPGGAAALRRMSIGARRASAVGIPGAPDAAGDGLGPLPRFSSSVSSSLSGGGGDVGDLPSSLRRRRSVTLNDARVFGSPVVLSAAPIVSPETRTRERTLSLYSVHVDDTARSMGW